TVLVQVNPEIDRASLVFDQADSLLNQVAVNPGFLIAEGVVNQFFQRAEPVQTVFVAVAKAAIVPSVRVAGDAKDAQSQASAAGFQIDHSVLGDHVANGFDGRGQGGFGDQVIGVRVPAEAFVHRPL